MEMSCRNITMGVFQANVSRHNDAFDNTEAMSISHMAASRRNNHHINNLSENISDGPKL